MNAEEISMSKRFTCIPRYITALFNNHQETEANWWKDKQDEEQIHNGILFGHKNNGTQWFETTQTIPRSSTSWNKAGQSWEDPLDSPSSPALSASILVTQCILQLYTTLQSAPPPAGRHPYPSPSAFPGLLKEHFSSYHLLPLSKCRNSWTYKPLPVS